MSICMKQHWLSFLYWMFYVCVSIIIVSASVLEQKLQNETCPSIHMLKLESAHEYMLKLNTSVMIAYLNENDNIEDTRNYIYEYYMDTFNLIYSMFDNIKDEHFWDSGCKLRWPVGWYLGHTSAFYMNKLRMNNYITNRTNYDLYSEYDFIFAQGTDEIDWNDFTPQHPKSYWPTVENVKIYVENTRDIIANIILTAPLTSLPINRSVPIWWTILMGIEHERIHIETSAMLIRQLPLHMLKDKINDIWSNEYPLLDSVNNIPPDNELISVSGNPITYGRASDLLSSDNDFFGWDAEYGSYTVNVTDFNVSKYMVSNYEFYQFYVHDGYLTREYWSEDAWRWLQEKNITHPKFWVIDGSNIKLRNLFSEIDMFYAWNRPVITNHYEADAFVKWKSAQLNKNLRLITEDEWYLLRRMSSNGNKNIRELANDVELRNGSMFPGNTNFYYFTTEAPIDIFKFGDFYDIIGNVWHHTISHYHPFNNYEIDPLYVDFSSPFFNDSYFLMKGGSYLSSGNMAMIYNRCQWFRSHYFQATGIRYVESNRMDINIVNNNKKTTKEYFANSDESDELCNECIHFQYANNNYREVILNVINEYVNNININNILDIGCSVGGVAYELANNLEECENIIGIDDRARFIGIANQIQQNKKLEYFMKNDYGQDEYYCVTLNELGMENIHTLNKIRFIHNDDLDCLFFNNENDIKYDLIIGENMFERYYDKLKIYGSNGYRLSDILNKNGTIILFEDYKWNKNHTVNVIDEMNLILGNKVKLMNEFNTKPIIRQNYESSTIKQYSLHCTIWNVDV